METLQTRWQASMWRVACAGNESISLKVITLFYMEIKMQQKVRSYGTRGNDIQFWSLLRIWTHKHIQLLTMVVSANIHGHGNLLPDRINLSWLKKKPMVLAVNFWWGQLGCCNGICSSDLKITAPQHHGQGTVSWNSYMVPTAWF